MAFCLLCLEKNAPDDSCIQFQSEKWFQLNILKIIEKHFWPFENLHPKVGGICLTCWEQLYDFHIFHKTIEEAHQRNIKLPNQRQHMSCHNVEVYDDCKRKISKETENDLDQKQSFPLPFVVIPNDLSNRICVKNEYVDDISVDQEYGSNSACEVLITESNEIIKDDNTGIETVVGKTKGKRGRPRKIKDLNEIHLKKPKGKRGRPKKNIDNSEVIGKQKSEESGRPREKIIVVDIKNRKRGRPRKIQVAEHTDSVVNVREANDSANLEQTAVQPIKLENVSTEFNVSLPQNNDEATEKENKSKNFVYNKIRKRKRLLQHKALMRNYIATSVRCMSFIKK